MLTNASCTVYREKTFERVFIPSCFWQASCGKTAAKGGMTEDSSVVVYIPEAYRAIAPKPRDIIVYGSCEFRVDVTSDKTISDSMRTLREYDPVTVRTVEFKCYGWNCRHVKAVAI